MKQKNQGKSILLLVGMMLATFFLVFHNYSFRDVIDTLASANHWWSLLAVAMIFVHLFGGGLSLKVLLKSLHRRISVLQGAKFMAIEFYFSGITPSASGGEPMQIYYMAKDGIEPSRGTSAKILITVFYKAVLLTLGLIVMIFDVPTALKTNLLNVWIWMVFLIGFVVNLVVIVVLLLAMFHQTLLRRISNVIIRFIKRRTRIRLREETLDKYENFLVDMRKSAVHFSHHKKESALAAGITLLQRLGLFSIPFFVYLALGQGGANYMTFLGIQVVVAIAADSLPLPGGVGASEMILLALYAPIYSEEMLATAMLLSRFVSYYLYLLIAAVITIANQAVVAKRGKLPPPVIVTAAPVQAQEDDELFGAAEGEVAEEDAEEPAEEEDDEFSEEMTAEELLDELPDEEALDEDLPEDFGEAEEEVFGEIFDSGEDDASEAAEDAAEDETDRPILRMPEKTPEAEHEWKITRSEKAEAEAEAVEEQTRDFLATLLRQKNEIRPHDDKRS